MKIYVASSWRNPYQPNVVVALRDEGHEVYDFRHPAVDGPRERLHSLLDNGFRWSDLDPNWEDWDSKRYRDILTSHHVARLGFEQDMDGLRWCDLCVLVLPCGRSAHLEAGWAAGAGKKLIILLLGDSIEPELMYLTSDKIVLSLEELLREIS